jgi:sugar transferase EpsL
VSRHRQLKRILDICLAAIVLVALSPLLGLVTIIIYLTMETPVLFRQIRPGQDAKPFALLKFRTMTTACDSQGRLLPDAERLTRFGTFLRQYSIDELPQLWNVLRGDLSMVGPRPLLMQYVNLYTPEQARRHEVMPGITGWAQINGRNALSWEEKFALDIWYVDNWSLKVDVLILLRTLIHVVKREGISNAGHATMPGFTGK